MIQNPYEKAIVDAAIKFYGDWKGYIKSPGSVEDLLQAVNDYLTSRKKEVVEIEPIKIIDMFGGKMENETRIKLNEVIAAVNEMRR